MGLSVGGVGSGYNYYGAISSGRRINSAADDPAGHTIAQKMKSQSNGTNAAMDNIKQGTAALNIADGGLSGIADYLHRMKELSVKAANGLNTKADKQAIQDEIDQLKQGINETANNTQYNTKNLLDGSIDNLGIVASANGSSIDIKMPSSITDALGISDYDVTGDFDMSKLDDALSKVSSQRSGVGANTNALDSAYRYSASSLEAVDSSLSSLEDLDIGKAVSDLKKQQLLNDMAVMMQKKREEDEANKAHRLMTQV